MNQYDLSGLLQSYSERVKDFKSEERLKDVIRELKKELDLRKIKLEK